MTRTKPVNTVSRPNVKNIGKKIFAVLNQPLFTLTFPIVEKKKPEPPASEKTVNLKKPAVVSRYRPIPGTVYPKPKPMHRGSNSVFIPSINREEFDKLSFVLRCRDRNSGRIFTDVLHVEQTQNGSRLITTDGKRMHVAEIGTKIKPGDYKPTVSKDLIVLGKPIPNVNFPNWERVVPVNTTRRGSINLENIPTRNHSRMSNMFTNLSGERVNPKYLADLTRKSWDIYCQNEKGKALLLKECGAKRKMYAVIMPLSG